MLQTGNAKHCDCEPVAMKMDAPANQTASKYHFTTDDLPERDRIAIWREEFGRWDARLEFEPLSQSFHAEFAVRELSGVRLMTSSHSPMRVSRTPQMLTDGNDDLVLVVSAGGQAVSHLGREFEIKAGDAMLSSNADTGTYVLPSAESKCRLLVLSRERLRPLLSDFDSVVARLLPANAPAMTLLRGYIEVLDETAALESELQHLVVAHIYDLAAGALGATDDAADAAKGRGLRAARLQAVKHYVTRNLGRHDLSAVTVAARLGVTPRYIHMLFEAETESFTEFVRNRRLALTHRMLNDPRFNALTISAIAMDAGFADLSHFNHSFRRRFGATPSEIRKRGAEK
jgi:AraC-like DNA-binding protein